MFAGITSKVFDDAEFKEDSVREVILVPLIARLGYAAVGEARVVRSKTLTHPFIRIGTSKHPVRIVPDYSFVYQSKILAILDAKAPTEDILADECVQQAYSYAIHPDVRCEVFALCNGRQLTVFSTGQREPLSVINFEEFESRWSEIESLLTVPFLLQPERRSFQPDFGTAISSMGFDTASRLLFPGVRFGIIAKLNEDFYTASASCPIGDTWHLASFDIPSRMISAVVAGLPSELSSILLQALQRAPFHAYADFLIEIDVALKLGVPTKGQHDTFIPLLVEEVLDSRLNTEPPQGAVDDIPPYVFRLGSLLIRPGESATE